VKFIVKDMDIATGGPMVAILNQKDAKKLDLHSADRLLVQDRKKDVVCILDISESRKAVPEGKIGLFEEVLDALGVKQGHEVTIKLTGKPESVAHIRKKLYGQPLTYTELLHITDDITHDRLSDIEKTYFVAASFTRGMSIDEIVHLTKAMVETGKQLQFPGITLDKHSIGGVPGNRTTMVVVPIIAAAGFTMPKTSSRAITSPAGTADTMECLATVELSEKKIKSIVSRTGGCMVHGGSMALAPADDKIIEVEHPLSIDAEGQLLASVMAKKYSIRAKHVLIDIPMGKNTKAATRKEALHLKKMFEIVGRKLHMNVKVIITDGSQPIGYGVGPLLETQDVLSILNNDPAAPRDLREKSLMMAGLLLEMTGTYKKGMGKKKAQQLLESGKALRKMHEIINAQGRREMPTLGKYMYTLRSRSSGKVSGIDNAFIAKVARVAGAPEDKGSGLLLNKKVGESVQRGEELYTIYAESQFNLDQALEFLKKKNGYVVR